MDTTMVLSDNCDAVSSFIGSPFRVPNTGFTEAAFYNVEMVCRDSRGLKPVSVQLGTAGCAVELVMSTSTELRKRK